MFEDPRVPESKLYPTDSKEIVGKEEWVAEKVTEIHSNAKLMMAALEWDAEETGAEDSLGCMAMYVASYWLIEDEMEAQENLIKVCDELAERYAEYVLLPAHIEKMKNGDFDGD